MRRCHVTSELRLAEIYGTKYDVYKVGGSETRIGEEVCHPDRNYKLPTNPAVEMCGGVTLIALAPPVAPRGDRTPPHSGLLVAKTSKFKVKKELIFFSVSSLLLWFEYKV